MIELNKELYERISNITFTDYENIKNEDNMILKNNEIISMLEDLLVEYDRKQEELEDLEQDIQDNYRRIETSSQVDVDNSMFI